MVPCLAGRCDDNDRHALQKVTPADIVGTWKMTASAQQLIKKHGYVASSAEPLTIDFNPDGSLLFQSALQRNGHEVEFNRCKGTWKLRHDITADNDRLRANVLEVYFERENPGTTFLQLSVAVENGKIKLWSYFGDPDEETYIDYQRPSATTQP
jgi:hypothetical protein